MKTINKSKIFILSLALILLQFSCNTSETSHEPGVRVTPDSTAEEHSDGISLTKTQVAAVGIQFGDIEQKNLSAVVKASGQLAVPPQNRAEVNVLIGGIIRSIHVLEGQHVNKGQTLATIENTEFISLQQDYLTTKNSFTYTSDELNRQKELNAANAGTGKNLQQAQATYNAEKAKISAMEKRLHQLGISPSVVAEGQLVGQIAIKAPISGTIGHIAINTGTYAETSKPLMEIIDNSQIHCDLVVFEKDLFKVKIGQQVNFMLTNQNNQQIKGKIYGINRSFEDDSKGIIVHAVIHNPSKANLIPGMYVTALIDVGTQMTEAVPVEAIVRSEGKEYVYWLAGEHGGQKSLHADEKNDSDPVYSFKKAEVVSGVRELGYSQVTFVEEVPTGAKIATKGAFYILSKEKATGHDDDH
jgi:cobalt-zinc-cadmium efflux system membrane fusion protein